MALKKLDYAGLQVLISAIKSYIDNRADATAEQKYRDGMREFFETAGSETATKEELTELCDIWFGTTRGDWDGYTRFYHPEKSSISEGTRGGDSTGLSCKPSTNSEAGKDDFAGNPLFVPTDCNWVMSDDGEPLITAIEGIKCAQTFVRNNPDYYVGVLQQTGFHWWTELSDESDYYYEGYCSKLKTVYTHIEPLPEAVILNDSAAPSTRTLLMSKSKGDSCNVRNWVLHSKYMSDLTDDNCMTSYSGGPTKTYVFSHNSSHTYAQNTSVKHNQDHTYSGATITDNAFLILMARIKYASLTMDGIIQGCVNYSFQYPVAISETGVKRAVVTVAQANNILVGSNLLVGHYTTTIDRAQPNTYSISGQGGYVVTSKTTEDINGTTYGVIYFDDADTSFDTVNNGPNTNGTTYISSFIWRTGSCDDILGNDGSPTNCTNGKEPAKLQGIEYMMGAYEVFADVILNLFMEGDTYYYEPYIVRNVSKQATSITADYIASGLRIQQGATAAWYYIVYMGYKNGLYFATQVGGSSTTYTRDAIGIDSNTIDIREWLSYGYIWYGADICGIYYLTGYNRLSTIHWSFATRLSCNGNRGVYSAS